MLAFKIIEKEIFDKYFHLISINYKYNTKKHEIIFDEKFKIENFEPC